MLTDLLGKCQVSVGLVFVTRGFSLRGSLQNSEEGGSKEVSSKHK